MNRVRHTGSIVTRNIQKSRDYILSCNFQFPIIEKSCSRLIDAGLRLNKSKDHEKDETPGTDIYYWAKWETLETYHHAPRVYIPCRKCEWHTIEKHFCPRGRPLKPEPAHGGAGETAGNWRQLDVVASLKPEIALASTFSRDGIEARTDEVSESRGVNPETAKNESIWKLTPFPDQIRHTRRDIFRRAPYIGKNLSVMIIYSRGGFKNTAYIFS